MISVVIALLAGLLTIGCSGSDDPKNNTGGQADATSADVAVQFGDATEEDGALEDGSAADSDVVILTAGLPRKPGMSRDDLIATNVKIVRSVSEQVAKHSPNAILIVVSNPLDAMVYTAWKASGFPTHRILGQAGCLDVARFRAFIAMELGVSIEDIQALLLGGHGDDMVPLPRYTTVGGISITQLMDADTIDAICARTAGGGGEIVKLLERGSAFYAPGSAAAIMAESIVKDRKRLIPASAKLTGQYGLDDVYIGVPIVLGRNGIERIIELELSEDELSSLQGSGNFYKTQLSELLGY